MKVKTEQDGNTCIDESIHKSQPYIYIYISQAGYCQKGMSYIEHGSGRPNRPDSETLLSNCGDQSEGQICQLTEIYLKERHKKSMQNR